MYLSAPGRFGAPSSAGAFHSKKLLESGRVDRIEARSKSKSLSVKTVRNINQMISSACNCAVEQRIITVNPTRGCALPKLEKKEMKILPLDCLNTFFEEAKRSGGFEWNFSAR